MLHKNSTKVATGIPAFEVFGGFRNKLTYKCTYTQFLIHSLTAYVVL